MKGNVYMCTSINIYACMHTYLSRKLKTRLFCRYSVLQIVLVRLHRALLKLQMALLQILSGGCSNIGTTDTGITTGLFCGYK